MRNSHPNGPALFSYCLLPIFSEHMGRVCAKETETERERGHYVGMFKMTTVKIGLD